jgi:RNA polymerase sigma-B factor
MEDLVQVGSIGLLKAVAKFDPEYGNGFVAFAVPVIVGEIKNYFRDHGWAIKIPRKLQSRKIAVDRTAGVLTQRLGRSPRVHEIAESTGFSEEEVIETFQLQEFGRPVSLQAEIDRGDGESNSSLLEVLGSYDVELEALADKLDLAGSFTGLDSREKTIIYLRYYSELSQTVIAERLGISQMHVSRLHRKALGKLKTSLVDFSNPL